MWLYIDFIKKKDWGRQGELASLMNINLLSQKNFFLTCKGQQMGGVDASDMETDLALSANNTIVLW